MDRITLYEGRACHTRHARVVTNETLLYDALLIDSLNLGGRTPPSDIDGERDEGGEGKSFWVRIWAGRKEAQKAQEKEG